VRLRRCLSGRAWPGSATDLRRGRQHASFPQRQPFGRHTIARPNCKRCLSGHECLPFPGMHVVCGRAPGRRQGIPRGPQTPLEGRRRREGPWIPSMPARSATRLLEALTAVFEDRSASPRTTALCGRTGPWTASAVSSSNRQPCHGHPAKVPTDVVSHGPAGD